MFLPGNPRKDLLVESDPAFDPADLGQQPVIETLAPAEPVARRIKAYPRHQHQVQLL